MRGFEVDYDRRLQALIGRRTTPPGLAIEAARAGRTLTTNERYQASDIWEVYRRLQGEGSAVQYTVGAMARVDPRYTEITYEQGDRVQNQLKKALDAADAGCDFEYQGSVTNDTHIKSYSDIDLLAITQRFHTLEPPQEPRYPYKGNPLDDLKAIRSTSCECLRTAFPKAQVDDSGAKCITISGGSLSRKIDVVPANWHDTNDYSQNGKAKRFRAIEVLNVQTGNRTKNTPFMHNYLIDCLDAKTGGGLRKVIRLMKSLKYDSGEIGLSSYDLAAIGYNMPEYELMTYAGAEIPLLTRLKEYLDRLVIRPELRQEMTVPDGSRKVFSAGHATLVGLDELRAEVDDLVEAVRRNLQKSFAKLAEARVAY